jgi:hypothetical protein
VIVSAALARELRPIIPSKLARARQIVFRIRFAFIDTSLFFNLSIRVFIIQAPP